MEFVPIAVFAALILKGVDFINAIRFSDWEKVGTQAGAWVVGIAVAFLLSGTTFGADITLGDYVLGDLAAADLLVVGLMGSSLASVGHDTIKAIRV